MDLVVARKSDAVRFSLWSRQCIKMCSAYVSRQILQDQSRTDLDTSSKDPRLLCPSDTGLWITEAQSALL